MDLLTVFKALKARSFPFRVLQAELNLKNMESATGWDRLIKKYEEKSLVTQDIFENDLEEYFEQLYLSHLYFGTKAVVMFPIEQEAALQLINKFSALDYANSPFQPKYPLPLNEHELDEILSSTPELTHYENDEYSRIVSCTKRTVKIREPIEVANLDSSDRNALNEYDEVYGIRCILFQSFDSIVIRPNDNRLEIHIDMSQPSDASGNFLTPVELQKTIKFYTNTINGFLKGVGLTLNNPINFFPLIPKLYDEEDGCVHQLGHATGTKSIKNEAMRDKKEMLDLRDELFHGAGLNALKGDTNCYSITKVWDTKKLGLPQLIIEGKFSQAGKPDALINHAIIHGCFCKQDFEMVLSKLL